MKTLERVHRLPCLVLLLAGIGCAGAPSPAPSPQTAAAPSVNTEELSVAADAVAETLLVDVQRVAPEIRVGLRYATSNNFTGAVLPGYEANRALLRREAAVALVRVQAALRRDGLGLRIYDGYRPVRATLAMVAWAERSGNAWVLDQGYVARRS